MRELQQVLSDVGLGSALAGWALTEATAISDDGLVIVGGGINPSGQYEGWFAVIPEPGTATLLGVGLIGLAGARRQPAHTRGKAPSSQSPRRRRAFVSGD